MNNRLITNKLIIFNINNIFFLKQEKSKTLSKIRWNNNTKDPKKTKMIVSPILKLLNLLIELNNCSITNKLIILNTNNIFFKIRLKWSKIRWSNNKKRSANKSFISRHPEAKKFRPVSRPLDGFTENGLRRMEQITSILFHPKKIR